MNTISTLFMKSTPSYKLQHLLFGVAIMTLNDFSTTSFAEVIKADTVNIQNLYVYDVSQVPQPEQPNLANWNKGASLTILPTDEDPGTASGARQAARSPANTLSGDFQFSPVNNTSPQENVVALLERDPTAAVMLPQGKRVVMVDTGSVATFNDFALKSFGAESMVTVELATDATSVNPETWITVQAKSLFNSEKPLNVDMKKQVGRYLKITFETSKAGLVGCLRVSGSSERKPTDVTITDETGNTPKNMSIKKVTHVNSGNLENIHHLTDNDFRTAYQFDQSQPVVMVFETKSLSDQPVERVSVLVNDAQPDGKLVVYGVDQLPITEPTAKGDGPQTPQVQLQPNFTSRNSPLGEVNFSPDGRAAINLPEPSTANYLVTVSQGTNIHSVAEVYAGPQPDTGERNLQSQALLNNLQRIPNPSTARVAPQLPTASALTP